MEHSFLTLNPPQKSRDIVWDYSRSVQPSYLSTFHVRFDAFLVLMISSDFVWDFGKLPFPTYLGKYFIKIGKIRAKIHEIGKIKAIFGLGMTPIYGLKNGQIKSLIRDKNISILHLSCRTSDLQISLVLQTHTLVL